MASGTVRVKGLREAVRAFNKLDRTVTREVQRELKQAAEPVVQDTRRRLGRFQGAKTATVRARASGPNVFVRQNARKVTGKRGDFGGQQMLKAFLPALEDNEADVVERVEETIGRLVSREGF